MSYRAAIFHCCSFDCPQPFSGISQAAPIAPLPAGGHATDAGNLPLRFIIIGIITDTTGITIIITTGITIIIVIIAIAIWLFRRGELTRRIRLRILQFGQLKFVEKTTQRIGLTLTAAVALIAGDGDRPPPGRP